MGSETENLNAVLRRLEGLEFVWEDEYGDDDEHYRLHVREASPEEREQLAAKVQQVWGRAPDHLLAFYEACNGIEIQDLDGDWVEDLIHGAAAAAAAVDMIEDDDLFVHHENVVPHLIPLAFDNEDQPSFAVYCGPPWDFPIVSVDSEAFRHDAVQEHRLMGGSFVEFLAMLEEVDFEVFYARYDPSKGWLPWVFDTKAVEVALSAKQLEAIRKARARDQTGAMLTPPSSYALDEVLRGDLGFPGAPTPPSPTLVAGWRSAFSRPGGEVTRRRFEERLLFGRALVHLLDESPTDAITRKILEYLNFMNFVEGADAIQDWAASRAGTGVREEALEVAGWIAGSARMLGGGRPLLEALSDQVVD